MMVGVHCIYFCMRCASAFKTRDVVQRIWQMHCTANILSNCPNCTLLSAIYNTATYTRRWYYWTRNPSAARLAVASSLRKSKA